MKKFSLFLLCLYIAFSLSACKSENLPQASISLSKTEQEQTTVEGQESNNHIVQSESTSNSAPQESSADSSIGVPVLQEQNDNTSQNSSQISSALPSNEPITPIEYQKLLGRGMDVDWCKTSQGIKFYNQKTVVDFKNAGVQHVRIRIKDKVDETLLSHLDRIIDDCLSTGLVPVIAYQADEFKNEPNQKNIDKVVNWWATVAQRYKNKSYLLSFDLLIEATDALNKQPEKLNEIYEQLVTAIRQIDSTRIIMMSPRLRSDAAYLYELDVPTNHNGYMMAEWHFYAAGPSKDNERKLWTTGTDAEKQLVLEKINLALQWHRDTGIPTWVGAWMPGDYNDGDNYTIEEQMKFAAFMVDSLSKSDIPFAVNSDTKFYNRETNEWIAEMQPVFNIIYKQN